jgi:hypothetical protein
MWISEGEFASLNNLRRLRNYTVHFQPPSDEESNVKDLFAPDPRSIDFEEKAKQVIFAAINVLHKTSI